MISLQSVVSSHNDSASIHVRGLYRHESVECVQLLISQRAGAGLVGLLLTSKLCRPCREMIELLCLKWLIDKLAPKQILRTN